MLNLAQLQDLILISTPNDASETVWKGKKRSASPRSSGKRPSKRAKTSTGSVHNHDRDDSDTSSSETLTPPALSGVDGSYPQLKYNRAFFCMQAETVPIIRHLLEIQYTGATNADNSEEGECNAGWKAEEEEFRAALVDLNSGLSEPRIIDLGSARLVEYEGHLVGVSDVLSRHTKEDGWLFLAPALTEGIDHDAHDLSSSTVADLLLASDFLRLAGKVSLHARLRVVILPSGSCDSNADDLPFRLQVELNLGLCLPQFFEPFSGKTNKKHVTLAEDAQRRLLHFAYGTNTPPLPPSFEGATNMSYFYSILGPAPSLESNLAEDAMQPILLNPTLLPFQRRSVGWLLNREGKAVTQSGAIVPQTSSNEFSFWDTIEEGNHTWYYNRLSGVLSTIAPSVSASLGGILAEEPGLGKTLETIAMILLNPAPEDRNPTLTRWDSAARLEVKAIKVSLSHDSVTR
jgi:E3 ubiquitin-protein ligase SHPRH